MTSGKLSILEPQFPHCKMGIIAPTLHIIRLGNIKYEAMHLAQNKLLINKYYHHNFRKNRQHAIYVVGVLPKTFCEV